MLPVTPSVCAGGLGWWARWAQHHRLAHAPLCWCTGAASGKCEQTGQGTQRASSSRSCLISPSLSFSSCFFATDGWRTALGAAHDGGAPEPHASSPPAEAGHASPRFLSRPPAAMARGSIATRPAHRWISEAAVLWRGKSLVHEDSTACPGCLPPCAPCSPRDLAERHVRILLWGLSLGCAEEAKLGPWSCRAPAGGAKGRDSVLSLFLPARGEHQSTFSNANSPELYKLPLSCGH